MHQALADGFISAATIMLMAVGFGLIWRCGRCLHFAHGVVFAAGPYSVYALKVWLGLPLAISLPLGVLLGAALGCAIELAVYRPLRLKSASTLILLMASIGVYVVLQNLIALVFGNGAKSFGVGPVKEGIYIWGARLTPVQLVVIGVGLGLSLAVTLALRTMKLGRGIRAVADDPELAGISGVPTERIVLWTFAIGSALASAAGILWAMDVDMRPTMGMRAFMLGMVAVIIGGVARPVGILVGALVLGLALHVGVLRINAQWQDGIAFGILMAFLLLRPEGFLGRKSKKVTV